MTGEQPPRLSRAEQQALTRDRLLEAAASVFAEHGVDGAAIDDIAARAGYSRGAFYSNFSDKTELLIALCDRRLTAYRREQLPALLAAPPEQRLTAVAAWLGTEQPPLEVLLVVELARQRSRSEPSDPALTAAIERVLEVLGGLLSDASEQVGELTDEERRARSAAVLAAVLGADLLRHLGLPPTARVLELLLGGIAPEAVT
ncbi:MAG: TetR/AcrR family transcriptional regulator [Nitriliruptoraceae bacterium]